jgi:FMN reductase
MNAPLPHDSRREEASQEGPPAPWRVVAVSAGVSDPSSTRLLADRLTRRVVALAEERGGAVEVTVIELRELASEIATALVSQHEGSRLREAITALQTADGIVASTPVYKAQPSGLFLSFFHLLDNDLLIAKPVLVAATAGTARHALVVDEQMRSLFAFMRAFTAPTSLFAATEDWGDPDLALRIDRAALELVLLMEARFAQAIKSTSWATYSHEYGSGAGTELSIDLTSDLMRLAAGGSAQQERRRQP